MLVYLLGVAAHRPALPIVVCYTSRDQLDTVCSAVSNLPFISLASLVPDGFHIPIETYLRRMATCLAADETAINVVVGGEVITLKNIEESSSLVIAEIP
ncbi:hypothetical protein POTOM_028147 [Populus tomentosa]|uniref:Uncharacterized protein n=1 Tax=Populus tomentosa TaxID=118781 RepID=A0A8X7ZIK8_POPTO|nr:hypothetical protein POTOM_028147 [Populus tomentosa]